ncbi:hypothetical protein BAJUN_01130 [Bajunvirus bajun]|uniref:Uncharacterized protein n=1 Tax=Brevundimonas phage vB_BgoS-Bajun TaxID=2948594 RepID=A0A9E7N6N9_9CAUD|nr:hypothetical protein BAJUN_01130 [Brevundimonas phage vB_BgoS-Bajun]
MIQYREHRGGLAESMETLKTFADRDELIRHVLSAVRPYNPHVEPADVRVIAYHPRPDSRTGWERTNMVQVAGQPWGYTDLEIEKESTDA